jgi:A/G-specific adenine glycosylase
MKSNNNIDAKLITPAVSRSAQGNSALIKSPLAKSLQDWYHAHRRNLPWRSSKDPYRIWISEIMLQQTMCKSVDRFYNRFLDRFPDVHRLASADLEMVYDSWSGLGYYSRARNLHKTAQIIAASGFPQTADQLIQLPGLGPYTSRAIASIAFEEPVGVLDGNVIRVLCRLLNLKLKWWETKNKNYLQTLSDQFAQLGQPSVINQALMELGATVCTASKPLCVMCPWQKQCQSLKKNQTHLLPIKKPRQKTQVLIWQPKVVLKANKIALVQNTYAPFLKKLMIFPGKILRPDKKPKTFDIKHRITHHDIYIQFPKQVKWNDKRELIKWINLNQIPTINPSSLMQKILQKRLNEKA